MDFLNRLFLAAGAVALVPIVIHLVQRRRVQQIVFGSLRFLRRTSHRVVHRRRFEEILLVVLRALALALLALAFARPFFRQPVRQQVGGPTFAGEGAALVLIDHSYSMRVGGRLERAKQEALEFLRQAGPSTKVGVAAYSSQFDELCPIGATLAQAEAAVAGIEQSWRGTRLDLALEQANRVLTRAGRNEEHRRIVLIGDFQDSSWENRDGSTLAPGIELTLREVAKEETVPNVLVGRVAVPRFVVAGGSVEVISTRIRNLTDQPLNDARVTFRINGELKGTRTVNLRPGEDAPVRFRHKFAEPGDVVGSIAVRADDALPHDNVARFCIHVTPRMHVLLVNADRGEKMVLNDGLFLRNALVPEAGDVVSPFDVREIAPAAMRPADLDGMDVVLFANTSTVPAAMTRVPPERQGARDAEFASPLGRFVAAGGGLGFLCGTRVVAAEFNRTFGGLAPCKLARLAMADGDPPVVINQVDLRHEIFAEFAQPHSGDVSLAEFKQYFLVTDSLRAAVPARFSNRDAHPALLERVFGHDAAGEKEPDSDEGAAPRPKGKTILFVSSMDLEWNNLCLKSVFVPFVHQLTKRLCARRTGSVRNFVVGEEITHHVPKGVRKAALRRRLDEPGEAKSVEWGEPSELDPRPAGDANAVAFSPDRPGIYELAHEGGSARFAVNLDPDEPDLRPLDTKLLRATVRTGPALEGATAEGAVSVVAKATVRERLEGRQRVWWYLSLAVLAVLAGEMALATRIGRA